MRRPRARLVLGLGIPLLIVVLLLAAWAIDSSSASGKVPRNVTLAGRGHLQVWPRIAWPTPSPTLADHYATVEVQVRTDRHHLQGRGRRARPQTRPEGHHPGRPRPRRGHLVAGQAAGVGHLVPGRAHRPPRVHRRRSRGRDRLSPSSAATPLPASPAWCRAVPASPSRAARPAGPSPPTACAINCSAGPGPATRSRDRDGSWPTSPTKDDQAGQRG